MGARAFIGLGSNLGDRLDTLQRSVRHLSRCEGVRVLGSSRVYETAPVGGPPGQPDFLNAVVEVETDLEPHELLGACMEVEEYLGRHRTSMRWGPRTIDLDILTYDLREVDEPDLVIPHPLMHERGFVLAPLLELDADPMLPGGRKVVEIRVGPELLEGVRPFAPPLEVGG